jgi:hypothetical protein
MPQITLDFILKLLDKSFSVAVAVICLLIMWKSIPIFAMIKMFLIENKEFCYNNQKIIQENSGVIKENSDVIKENTDMLKNVKETLK